jgi:hypothetical protein
MSRKIRLALLRAHRYLLAFCATSGDGLILRKSSGVAATVHLIPLELTALRLSGLAHREAGKSELIYMGVPPVVEDSRVLR